MGLRYNSASLPLIYSSAHCFPMSRRFKSFFFFCLCICVCVLLLSIYFSVFLIDCLCFFL